MTSYAGISPRHVNTYHHNNSLLLQFLLVEFLEAFTEIQRLDILQKRTPLPNHEATSRQKESEREQIEASLAKLVGSTRDYMRLFSWNFSEGLLVKLKTYCTLFLQNAEGNEKELIAMQHYAEKIWQACLLAIDALHETPQERAPLVASLDKACSSMHRFSKLAARLIHQFREDENVIFFVVRHHQRFDRLYGNRFVYKLLNRMYQKGLRETQQVLVKKYTERGFDNILPIIQTNLAEIEAAAL